MTRAFLEGSCCSLHRPPSFLLCRQVKAGYSSERQCYEIISQSSYRRHEQVFINYGAHDNTKLLLEYGFIVPHNPHNSVPVELGESAQQRARRAG